MYRVLGTTFQCEDDFDRIHDGAVVKGRVRDTLLPMYLIFSIHRNFLCAILNARPVAAPEKRPDPPYQKS
jgi:hypothetical protein